MKKLGTLFKEISGSYIRNELKGSGTFFIIRYSGLSSPDLTALRQSLKNTRAKLFVVKNCIARRALQASGMETLVNNVDGQCGLVFVKDEPVSASKVLYDFSKDHEKLKLEGGFFDDRVLQKRDIENLARLPSKETLRAQAVVALKSPISGLVFCLNQTLRKFVYCLEQVKNKKSNG